MRRGLRGQFKCVFCLVSESFLSYASFRLVQLFLVAGHLVSFRIEGQSSLYPSIKKKINLVEAYVCSGYFAAQTLPRGQYSPNTPAAPRRYGDGLETDDREEDMIFMIWYRSHSQMLHADQDPTTTSVDNVKFQIYPRNSRCYFSKLGVVLRGMLGVGPLIQKLKRL
jgi:hypothetical protein